MKTHRREFIRTGLGMASAVSVGTLRCAGISGAVETKSFSSRVAVARDRTLRSGGSDPDEKRLIELLDRAMQAFYDRDDPLEAWRLVVKPEQVVGLKVNCLAGKGLSTSVALVSAAAERLQQAGITGSKIVVWDRLNRDLERGGFRVKQQGPGPLCFGNDHLGYDQRLETYDAVGSLICRTLSEVCDVVINMPVLKDHGITGMTMAMKNMFGAIHNPNKYHLNTGDPYVADVYMLPPIRKKVALTICDAITAQYEGGPSYMPHWTWPFNGVVVGIDPVALDTTGWRILEKQRKSKGMPTLKTAGREPTYIATAADPQHRLGTNRPDRIEVVKI
jgi:uncharacterized protein (DUF362 family)